MPLSLRITQAGLTWSKRRFFITSAVLGVAAFLIVLMMDAGLLPALAMGLAAPAPPPPMYALAIERMSMRPEPSPPAAPVA